MEERLHVDNGHELVIGIMVRASLNGLGESLQAMDDMVFRCHCRDGHCQMPEADSVRDDNCAGVPFYKTVAPIVMQGQADVETIIGAEVPKLCGGLGIDEYPAPWWAQGRESKLNGPERYSQAEIVGWMRD